MNTRKSKNSTLEFAKTILTVVLVSILVIVALFGVSVIASNEGLFGSKSASADSLHESRSKALPGVSRTILHASTSPQIYLSEPRAFALKRSGDRASMLAFASRQVDPLAVVESDLDHNGISDLIVGYAAHGNGIIAIQRGNLDAFAPQSDASFKAIGRGNSLSPFLSNSQSMSIPITPDFLAVGGFTGAGQSDLLVGSRDVNVLYIYPEDGKGKFTDAVIKTLPGTVTALAGGRFENNQKFDGVIVGVSGKEGPSLEVLERNDEGLALRATFPLRAPVSRVAFGDLDGDSHPDAAILAGDQVFLLREGFSQLRPLALPGPVADLALGEFVIDRNHRQQMALLRTDGSVQLAVPAEFDPRTSTVEEVQARLQARRQGVANLPQPATAVDPNESWHVIENYPGIATAHSEHRSLLLRTRISSHAADDVVVLDPSAGQMSIISHADEQPGATDFTPGQISTRSYSGSPIAALAVRLNVDGRSGMVTLNSGHAEPSIVAPLAVNTYTVTGTGDTSPIPACTGASPNISCPTLRGAIQAANANPGTDTIMIPAGTYTLALPRINGNYDGNQGTLEVLDSVNIVGAGQATTIIQGGPSIGNGVDMVMAVNEDIGTITNASASISNLTIRFGTNRGSVSGFDGDGGGMEFDTGSSGNANLTLTNVTFDSNQTLDGNGAGLAVFNFSAGPTGGNGLATLNNCIFTNNSAKEKNPGATGSGGGMFVFDLARANISNTQFTNNIATGVGGGVGIFSAGQGSRTSNIHSSTITGNTAGTDGGGVYSSSNLLIDSGTLIDNNQATGGVNVGLGGGVRVSVSSPDTVTLTKVTVSNNKATNGGGGLASGNGSGGGPAVIQFSRFANNTIIGAGSGTNINNNHSTITATNNWWGTNSPAATIVNTVATTTFDPFIVLTHTASPNKIRINQSTTLTADMSKDNHGNGAALAGNLDRIIGLPVTFGNAVLGTIPQAQPETLNASAQATATFNAGGTSGLGHADATVDQQTVTVNIPVLEPLRIVKSFGAGSIPINGTTSLNLAITNPNVIAVDGSFTDSLPANMKVAAVPGVTNTCGGTVTAVAGSASISFSNASVAVGACSVSVNVTATVDNVYSNSVTINSTDAGTGALSTSSANLTVINAPHIVKAFGASPIRFGETTSLTFTLDSNGNQNLTLNGVAFSDTLQAGLKVATPSNVSTTCSNGSASAVNGSSSVSLSGANVAPNSSCTVSANVVSTAVGTINNSVTATSTNGGSSSTANASLSVIKADTTTTLTSSVNPSVFGQSVTFTATVSAVAPGVGTPTGTVTFLDGGNSIGTGTLSGGVATFSSSAIAVGNHTITTSYGGDTNFNGSTGSLTGNPQVVNKANSSSSVTSSLNPSIVGQSVTFTATVTAVAPGVGTPTGTVTFLDGGNSIGTGTLSSGVATFSTSALAVGSHTITTSYGGDTNFNSSTGSLTGNPQVVNKANTSTSVTSSNNPSLIGQSVTFTATVSAVAPGVGTPTGTVTFLDGGNSIGTGTLSGGVASFSTSALAVGNHTITTSYGGDASFNSSTGSLTGNPQVVNKANNSTSVSSSNNPSIIGQSVTFTATVSAVAPGTGTPTGIVTFLDGGNSIGTGTLSGGVATFSTNALAVGNHTITTSYSGDSNFNGSTGSLTGNPQVINKADTNTAVTSSANPANLNQSVTFTATVSAVAPGVGTATGTVTFLDGGNSIGTGTLSGGVATFSTSALAVGNHTITTSYGGDTNFNGSTGSLTGNPQVVSQVTTISVLDAKVAEPPSGSVNMIFTVTLSAPAPVGGAAVNFTTQDQAPALNHATAGQDYTATSGTVNFAQGEQFKTILVPVLADNKKSEQNETFLVNLSNPVNAQIAGGTATGTILITNQPGTILISELRTSGPAGAGDDFVEIYNNSDTPHSVNDGSGINDAAHGYGLFKMGADCSATPVLIGVIPNGTVIPARGHYLFVGSAYSLADYGGSGAAAGDQVLSQDIESDRNVAIFSTTSLINLSTVTRLDAVGFGSNTGGVCDLLREGTTLTPLSGSVLEYSYFRDECGKKGNPAIFGPCPTAGFIADTNVNGNDFIFADTNGTVTPAGQRLGAPGPQNLGGPRLNLLIPALLLDVTKSSTMPPNRVRDNTPLLPNGMQGTLSIRRRFVNNTGAPVTRLRLRIVDMSALSLQGGIADLRALTSGSVTVTGIADSATCLASTGSATTPCSVTVQGTTVETPPAQALGGALNSSMTVTLGTPLAAGASINLQFLLGVQQTGSFKFFINVEALP